jgi:acetoin utilization deacetylase AcuC-like enzyme
VLRIRRIFDLALPVDREAMRQVREILQARFAGVPAASIAALDERLRDPFPGRLRPIVFVAEDHRRVLGFASVLQAPDLAFLFLEYIATASAGETLSRGGVGGALFERVRQQARALGCRALFLEAPSDDPALASSPAEARQNAARLRFYERFGVLPIAGTDYELPVRPGGAPGPHLLYDDLGSGAPLRRAFAREAVRAILERYYPRLCPPEYVERVVASFRNDPVRLREPRHLAAPAAAPPSTRPREAPITLVVADQHDIHHVRERGYVEAPARVGAILAELEPTGLFTRVPRGRFPLRHVEAVHKPELVRYLRRACRDMPAGKALYPYVFPLRNRHRLPAERSVLAGYFCIDTFTPITRNAYLAAKGAVDCTLTAAGALLAGAELAYALVRPPGHHAEQGCFGGFCYFNNAAVAAQQLSGHGRVAILDVDYHHGNGQQDIFWRRADVLTVSLHGHPRFAYPYFSGFSDERGEGEGEGANLNLPLPERQDGIQYRRALARALEAVAAFAPRFLVVALGLDPAKGDPTGTWSLGATDFQRNGELVRALGLPTLVVQEGGYRTRTLGANVAAFFRGLAG